MTIRKIRFRTEGALVVLQVQESTSERYYPNGEKVEWRDAKVEDLLDVGAVVAPVSISCSRQVEPQTVYGGQP